MSMLFSSLVGQPISGKDVFVSGMALDSRHVGQGNLFFAVKGQHLDGHKFIDAAIRNGASAVAVEREESVRNKGVSYVVLPALKKQVGEIASRFYGDPTSKMIVTGVTGTNGKTSITSYIRQLFNLLNIECGEIGTLGIRFGNTVIETKNTTPDPILLQQNFYNMLQGGISRAVMEVSSHAMDQDRCQGIHFSIAVYSNISHDHLDYHGSLSAYINAKAKLFSLPGLSMAIVNIDDASGKQMIASVGNKTRLITYSLKNEAADVYLTDITSVNGIYKAKLRYCGNSVEFETSLLGEFNLYNLVAAVISVCEQGFPLGDVIRVCRDVRPVSGRMQLIENVHGITAIVDYAHTPDAMENVLKSIREICTGRIITVFGCGGDRDREKRPVMAAIAEKYSDYVVITADNPRNESVTEINRQIETGMRRDSPDYCVCEDRRQAIEMAVNLAAATDCVLVAGKGHEKTQIIGDTVSAFDDARVLAEALENKKVLPC